MKVKTSNSLSVSISKKIITDGNLTPGAKGLFAFLMAVKADYDISKAEIRKYNNIGLQGLNTILKELEEYGYLTEVDGSWVLDNGNDKKINAVARTQERSKAPRKSKRDWTDQRIRERREFVLKVQEAVLKMKNTKITDELLRTFLRYWASIDSIDPSKKMMFQTKQTFNIPARIRTFIALEEKRNKEIKKQDRL